MAVTSRPTVKKTRVRISKSGQITLPAKIRRQLGVEVGDQIEIVQTSDGDVRIHAIKPLSIDEFAGSLGPPPDGQTLTDYLHQVDQQPMVRTAYEDKKTEYDPD